MQFIVENWYIIVLVVAAVVAIVLAAVKFFKSSSKEQIEKIREWLLYATTLAEKELGGGTGKIKLRYVYDMFVEKFTWLAKIITFERFSNLVDEVLGDMNDLLTTNAAVNLYVNGPAEEDEEAAEG